VFRICAESSVLVTAEQCLHGIKAFSASYTTPPPSRLGVHKKLGGDTAGTTIPVDQRDIPDHTTSCSAMKSWGKRGEGGDTWSDGVCLPKQPLCVMEPCFPGDG